MTEDDTFNALRRIPYDSLNERLSPDVMKAIERGEFYEIDLQEVDALTARLKKYPKYIRDILYKKALCSENDISARRVKYGELISDELSGSGWTIDTYCNHVRELIKAERKKERNQLRKRAFVVVGIILSTTLAASVGINLLAIDTVLGHLMVWCSIVTFNSHFPYIISRSLFPIQPPRYFYL